MGAGSGRKKSGEVGWRNSLKKEVRAARDVEREHCERFLVKGRGYSGWLTKKK